MKRPIGLKQHVRPGGTRPPAFAKTTAGRPDGLVWLLPRDSASGGRAPPWTGLRGAAFSLVEVVIAVGLFAASVTVVIALLPALTRQGAVAQDMLAAQRLPDALKVELSRLAAVGSFDALAGRAPVMDAALDEGLPLVASRDASRLHSRDYLRPATGIIADDDQYYLVECWRFPDEPLRHDGQKHFLAFAVRVSWPYRLRGAATPTAADARTQAMLTVSLTR